ncbi:tetratricopeptide repeat protein [Kamptonema animale CS-326]|jgi:tetratricopeptide (TPR) repeat protein|uniref:tetratricopeptide repeat protein n=1 Tax=Kamptonema animale TaxID=92934 RepID=UPI00232DABDE|nr:tetratricopeptide repeat protein [Kamptonema animale]MDB9510642.1 tetratricopeptide repeat protein [Kamptonema animale CS-326]
MIAAPTLQDEYSFQRDIYHYIFWEMLKKFKNRDILTVVAVAVTLITSQAVAATTLPSVKAAKPTPTLLASQILAENSSANDYFQKGVALVQKQDLAGAEAAFRKAIEINPNFAEAYANLGSVLANQDKLEEAISNFEKAVSLKPNVAVLHYLLGRALYEQNRPQEAAEPLKKARDLFKQQGQNQEAETIERVLKENGLE